MRWKRSPSARVPPAQDQGCQGPVSAQFSSPSTPSASARAHLPPTVSSSPATTAAKPATARLETRCFNSPSPAQMAPAPPFPWMVSGRFAGTTSSSRARLPSRSVTSRAPCLARDHRAGRQEYLAARPVFAHRVWYRTRVNVPRGGGTALLPGLSPEQLEHDVYVERCSLRFRQEPVRPGADRYQQGGQAGNQQGSGRHSRCLVWLLGKPHRTR